MVVWLAPPKQGLTTIFALGSIPYHSAKWRGPGLKTYQLNVTYIQWGSKRIGPLYATRHATRYFNYLPPNLQPSIIQSILIQNASFRWASIRKCPPYRLYTA